MTQNKLNICDKVYSCLNNTPTKLLKIKRVTETQAISNSYTFKRMYAVDGQVTEIGVIPKWSTITYFIETPELIRLFNRTKILNKIDDIIFEKYSTELLEQILKVLTEAKPQSTK